MSKSTLLLFTLAVLDGTLTSHVRSMPVADCDDTNGPICIDSRLGNASWGLAFDGSEFITGVNTASLDEPIRCPIGMCGNKWGNCGPDIGPNSPYVNFSREVKEKEYCNAESTGDWRVVPCDGEFAVEVHCDDLNADFSGNSTVQPDVDQQSKCIDRRYGDPTWIVVDTPDGILCGKRAGGKPYRCPFGMCCSSTGGYCGPARAPDGSPIMDQDKNLTFAESEDLYCKKNAGDWRFVSCDSPFAIYTNGSLPVRSATNGTVSAHSDINGTLSARSDANGTLSAHSDINGELPARSDTVSAPSDGYY